MKYKKVKLSAVFLLGLGLTGLQAQETVPASGGDASGSAGTVSYSVGQMVYTTKIGSNGSVAQGVQQPYEISVITELEETIGIILEASAYPNPTNDRLTLKVENYANEKLSYQLYDINGRLLEYKKMNGNKTTIMVANLVPATYILKVANNQKEIKTFKIIINQIIY